MDIRENEYFCAMKVGITICICGTAEKILNGRRYVDLSDDAKKTEIMVEREETIKEKVLEMTIEELDMSSRRKSLR